MDTLVSQTEIDMNSGNFSQLYILPFEYLTSLLFRCHSNNEPFSYHTFNCLNIVHVRYSDPDCNLVLKKSKIFNPCFELKELKPFTFFLLPKLLTCVTMCLTMNIKVTKVFR